MKIKKIVAAGGLAALLFSGCCSDVYRGTINGKDIVCEVCPDIELYKVTIENGNERVTMQDYDNDGFIEYATLYSETTPYELSGDEFDKAQKKYDYYKPICETRGERIRERAVKNLMN